MGIKGSWSRVSNQKEYERRWKLIFGKKVLDKKVKESIIDKSVKEDSC